MGRKIKEQGATKICVKCGKELPNTNEYFAKRYKRKDGTYLLTTKCKECVKIESKEYRENNKEKVLEQAKRYREANREKKAEQHKRWYEANKEKVLDRQKQYRENNKEKITEQRKQRYEANREKELKKSKQYYENNKEKIAEHKKQYRQDNKEKIAEQRKKYYEANKEKIAEQRKQWYEAHKDEISKKNKQKYKSKKRDIPKYKVCSSCGDILLNTTDNFRKVTKGHSSKCKKCECKASKQWYDSHKEQRAEHDKIYYQEHKERKQETSKIWYQNNREERLKKWQEYRKSDHGKQVIAAKRFNDHNKRRLLEQNQGKGITSEQYKEVMSFFDWKCAYSGEKLKKDTRTLDHIISLKQGGDHEIWNLVPMTRSLNSSKQEKDMLEWYKEQDCYSEARLAKIYEWQEYARKKWEK